MLVEKVENVLNMWKNAVQKSSGNSLSNSLSLWAHLHTNTSEIKPQNFR